RIDDRKLSLTNCRGETRPSLGTRMMVSKDQRPVILENSMAFGEHCCQFCTKSICSLILNFLRATSCKTATQEAMRLKALPRKKEIRQFRVMHVIEEGRVGHNYVHRFSEELCVVRTSTGEANGPRRQATGRRPGSIHF